MNKKYKIGVIGLGYVGLPLAIEFGKFFPVVGYDINKLRVNELKEGEDKTLEVDKNEIFDLIKFDLEKLFFSEKGVVFTNNLSDIENCNFYIITVPTPIDKHKRPDLSLIKLATENLAKILSKNDIVVYESTVYPGLTEEICIPILEKYSNLKLNKDLFVGYSPERINPGDKERKLPNIVKITSGSSRECAIEIDSIYSQVIAAGTYLAPSIKVAEAAKVIENSQRDINIAFINELAKIFSLMNIRTDEVLKAASTKWNFLNFKPGLVGGHCIGVDPYYLAMKAKEIGYNPNVILSGRIINDSMGEYVADQLIREMQKRKIKIDNSNILILGITFKENCPDTRNSKVFDVIECLKNYNTNLCIYDPWISLNDFENLKHLLVKKIPKIKFDAILLTVAHQEFLKLEIDSLKKDNCVVYDIKSFLNDKSSKCL